MINILAIWRLKRDSIIEITKGKNYREIRTLRKKVFETTQVLPSPLFEKLNKGSIVEDQLKAL